MAQRRLGYNALPAEFWLQLHARRLYALTLKILIMNILKSVLFFSTCAVAVLLASCTSPKAPNLLVNSGFEELTKRQKPIAWVASQHAGKIAYTHKVDTEVVYDGLQSYRMEQHAKQTYGLVMQSVTLPDYENKTFSFTAMLKTKEVAAGNGWKLVLNCKTVSSRILKQYQSEPMNGTTDWQTVTLEGAIPKGTVKFDVGIMLMSMGTGWVDNVYLSVN